MKRKWFGVIIGAIMASLLLATPVFALYLVGVHFNTDAVGQEIALRLDWGDNKPDTEIKAVEFEPVKKETITEVEQRIRDRFLDALMEDVKWNQLDSEEEPYLSDVLSCGEEIIYKGTQKYLRTHKAFVNIHIYSLDDPETPESELSFTTKAYKNNSKPAGTTWAEHFPEGWWD